MLGALLVATTLAAAQPTASPVEWAALEAAAARVAAPDRFEPTSWRIEGAEGLADDVALEVQETVGPDPSGTVRVRFKARGAGAPAGIRVVVHGRVLGPALVVRRALPAAAPIDPQAVELAEADLTRLAAEPLREVGQLSGLAPLHALGAGRPLTADLLAPLPIVHRGDTMELRIERGRLAVRAVGIAREDGAPGDLVTAENAATGSAVVGRVQPDGSLLVLRSRR
jgi:flagella basal body P-ring formation protein FlgA